MTETVERCPDCDRVKFTGYAQSGPLCITKSDCAQATIALLRAEVATLRERDEHTAWERGYEQGYSDREKTDHDRADVLKEPNPYPPIGEVREREQLEAAVVEAGIVEYHERAHTIGTDLNVAVRELLAHRQRNNDGNR